MRKYDGTLLQFRCDEKGFVAVCIFGMRNQRRQEDRCERSIRAALKIVRLTAGSSMPGGAGAGTHGETFGAAGLNHDRGASAVDSSAGNDGAPVDAAASGPGAAASGSGAEAAATEACGCAGASGQPAAASGRYEDGTDVDGKRGNDSSAACNGENSSACVAQPSALRADGAADSAAAPVAAAAGAGAFYARGSSSATAHASAFAMNAAVTAAAAAAAANAAAAAEQRPPSMPPLGMSLSFPPAAGRLPSAKQLGAAAPAALAAPRDGAALGGLSSADASSPLHSPDSGAPGAHLRRRSLLSVASAPLRVCIGVTTGVLLCTYVGARALRLEYTVYGDAINLSARLSQVRTALQSWYQGIGRASTLAHVVYTILLLHTLPSEVWRNVASC